MEVHKPKPWHGWREFLKEYAIVVVGVLTALAAEQMVENLHWGERVHETRHQLDNEMGDNANAALAWLSLAPCFDRQLVDLRQQLLAARSSGSFSGTRAFAPPLFVFTSDAWLNARALQVSDHLPASEAEAFTQAYFFPSELAGDVTRLHEEAGELSPLAGPMRITAPEADEFLSKVGRAKELESRMDLGMMLMIRKSHQLGAAISPSAAATYTHEYKAFYGGCIADPAQVLKVVLAADMKGLYGEASPYLRLKLSPPELPE